MSTIAAVAATSTTSTSTTSTSSSTTTTTTTTTIATTTAAATTRGQNNRFDEADPAFLHVLESSLEILPSLIRYTLTPICKPILNVRF